MRLPQTIILVSIHVSAVFGFLQPLQHRRRIHSNRHAGATATTTTSLGMSSLKVAAVPLMDSGKALARSGEFLIDLTTSLDMYGGALSAAGAQIRNAGDAVAQAAASCRFKTGTELVIDELRESATCMSEAVEKAKLAVEEANVDGRSDFAQRIESTIMPLDSCSRALETAGAGIMQRLSMDRIGEHVADAGNSLQSLAPLFKELAPQSQEAKDCCQRMSFAAEKMIEAGNELRGIKPKAKGKSWLKSSN